MTKKSTREVISKTTRFEVFKRDNFACQYCGAKAPEVVLHCDHINPVTAGGDSGIMNLVTACADCNRGKGARKLDDGSAVERERARVEELQARREQHRRAIHNPQRWWQSKDNDHRSHEARA